MMQNRFLSSVRTGLVMAALFGALARDARADLVARYDAEGNANDATGAHGGQLINGAGFGPGHSSALAFLLNGTNQYVSVPDSPAWAFATGDFTVSSWANLSTVREGPGGQLPDVFVGQDQGGGVQPKWVFFYGNGKVAFHVINGATQEFLYSPSAFVPTPNEWHLFTVARSANLYRFYADGAPLGELTNSTPIPDVNAPLTIGQAEHLGFLTGRIDDVRIYDRALTSAEVAALAPEPSSVAAGLAFAGFACRRRRRGA
jgi:hypothetical protein